MSIKPIASLALRAPFETSREVSTKELASAIKGLSKLSLSEIDLTQLVAALKDPRQSDQLHIIIHDSGNDEDDQQALLYTSLQIRHGSIRPEKLLVIGVPNPSGADANSVAQAFLERKRLPLPEDSWVSFSKATCLHQTRDDVQGLSTQTQKAGAKECEGSVKFKEKSLDEARVRLAHELSKPVHVHVGAACGPLVEILLSDKAITETLREITDKVLAVSESKDLKEKALIKQIQEELLRAIIENPDKFLSEGITRENIRNLNVQFQGGVSERGERTGQNQKFDRMHTLTDFQLVEAKDLARIKTESIPVVAIPDAEILYHLSKRLGFQLSYFSANTSVPFEKSLLEKVEEGVFDTKTLDFIELDNLQAKAPALLTQKGNIRLFFDSQKLFEGHSVSFSVNATPYRALVECMKVMYARNTKGFQQTLKERNSNPREVLARALARMNAVVDHKIANPADFFEKFYCTVAMTGIAQAWNPNDPASNIAKMWRELGGEGECFPISEISARLERLAGLDSSESLTLKELFALELFSLHAAGLEAQSEILKRGVKGTQEDCYRVVCESTSQYFDDFTAGIIPVAPYDLEAYLHMQGHDEVYKTAVVVGLLGHKILTLFERVA